MTKMEKAFVALVEALCAKITEQDAEIQKLSTRPTVESYERLQRENRELIEARGRAFAADEPRREEPLPVPVAPPAPVAPPVRRRKAPRQAAKTVRKTELTQSLVGTSSTAAAAAVLEKSKAPLHVRQILASMQEGGWVPKNPVRALEALRTALELATRKAP